MKLLLILLLSLSTVVQAGVCKNGYLIKENHQFYEPEECGCPDGGQLKRKKDGVMVCVKGEYQYDFLEAKKYVLVYPEDWGCPQGSVQKGPMCCKDGYAYSNYTFKFDKVDGYCGCPDGGKPAAHYLKDKYLHPCCKGEYMYNPQTKSYDRKNKVACNVEAAKKMAEEYAKSLQKHADERGLDPIAHAAEENLDLVQEITEIGRLYSDVPEMY